MIIEHYHPELLTRASYQPFASACSLYPSTRSVPCKDFFCYGFIEAYSHAVYLAQREELALSIDTAISLHKKLYGGLPIAGVIRSEVVSMNGGFHSFPHPSALPDQIMDFNCTVEALLQSSDKVAAAALIHQGLVDIHPFYNGNGRVARLMMNIVLLHYGYTALFVTPDWRLDYSRALEAGQSGSDKEAFVQLIQKKVQENEAKEEFKSCQSYP